MSLSHEDMRVVQDPAAFIGCARDRNCGTVALNDFIQSNTGQSYCRTLTSREIVSLTPVFGIVSANDDVSYIDRRAVPAQLISDITRLARLFAQATEYKDVRFTLSNIRDGMFHSHVNTFMTYAFCGDGTETHHGVINGQTPFLFKAGIMHRSPMAKFHDPRMVCTFFPKTD